MKRSEYQQWLEDKITGQRRVTLLGVTAMAVVGLIAVLGEFFVFYLIINFGFIGSKFLAFLVTLLITGGIMAWIWKQTPARIGPSQHTVDVDGSEVQFSVALSMAPLWTYALGSLETERTFAERLLGFLAMPQRLVCTAWHLWQRHEKLQSLDIPECAKVLRLLFRKAERVEVAEIAEECKLTDLPRTLHEVSLIDGVVFLTRRGVGLSLANRLTDDLRAWKAKRQPETTGEVFGD